ncbi:MAG: c-type cytochrome [Gemmatimonadota bacterium]
MLHPARRSLTIRFFALALILAGTSCSGEGAWPPGGADWDPSSPEAQAILAAPDPESELNRELTVAGERFYRTRGCLGCHSLGQGDVVGPDLEQVASRREYPWFRGMVMNPDSMNQNDAEAQALAESFPNPMPNQGVPELQVRAIWEYLREVDREAEER